MPFGPCLEETKLPARKNGRKEIRKQKKKSHEKATEALRIQMYGKTEAGDAQGGRESDSG